MFGKRLVEARSDLFDGTIREIAMAFSFDAPELDLEAESPAPRSEPAAESRRKPPQSK